MSWSSIWRIFPEKKQFFLKICVSLQKIFSHNMPMCTNRQGFKMKNLGLRETTGFLLEMGALTTGL
jgi:hypothetical protein